MAGWQLVKCTSTYLVSPFWRGVERSFVDTIKKCIYGGLLDHFAGRGVGKYLHICRRQPVLFVNACRFLFRDDCV